MITSDAEAQRDVEDERDKSGQERQARGLYFVGRWQFVAYDEYLLIVRVQGPLTENEYLAGMMISQDCDPPI